MTTPLERIKERIEKMKSPRVWPVCDNDSCGATKAYAQAISDIQAILPSIIQEVVDEIYREGMDYEDLLASLKSEPNNV